MILETEVISTVLFGCGNPLIGDDGFGPAVIAQLLQCHTLPENVTAIDAGTGVREYLLDYLLAPEQRPDRLIVIDAGDYQGCAPGQVMVINPAEISCRKIHDFSLHQFPTVNLLQELAEETNCEILLLTAQINTLPSHIAPGLSKPMLQAVTFTCRRIMQILTVDMNVRHASNDV